MDEKQAKDGGKIYEIGFHIDPFVSEDNVAHEVTAIKTLLEKIKAEVIAEDFPRLRALAYPLSKAVSGSKKTFKEAYFGWIKFEAEAGEIPAFQKEVEKIESIIRYIVIKTVRENTLQGNKFSSKYEGKPQAGKEAAAKEIAEKGPINPEEIDKTIENLVIE